MGVESRVKSRTGQPEAAMTVSTMECRCFDTLRILNAEKQSRMDDVIVCQKVADVVEDERYRKFERR